MRTFRTQLTLLLLAGLCTLPRLTPARAQSAPAIANGRILELVAANEAYAKEVRRHLHEYPELGGQETQTVKYLKRELARSGRLDIYDVPGSTGFYAVLDTRRPGKTIGLRTDIDGLPIKEHPANGEGKPKPWLSRNEGVTQGCGHDGHMAILLTTVRILQSLRDELTGRYVFIFEEGEETNTGIRPMVEALRAIPFDVIYGNHVASNVPSGQLFIQEGPVMAGMATLAWHVHGKGGHASRPDLAVNPVFASAGILNALSTAWNNQRDITKLVTLAVTQVQGGQVYNVIPDSVFLGGTLRYFDPVAGERALELVRRVAAQEAAVHGCTVSFDPRMRIDLPPVVNDTTTALRARQAIESLYPGHITTDPSSVWYASETFTLYSQLAPSLLTLVGVRNEEKGTTAQHHTDRFDLDEDALRYGIGAMVKFAVSY